MRAMATRMVDAHHPTVVEFEPPDGPTSRLCLPVRLQDSVVGFIWLDLIAGSSHELDSRAIEHASVVAVLHLMHQRQLVQREERLGNALVAGLLDVEFNPTTMPVAPIRTTRMVSLRRPLGRYGSKIGSEGDGLPALHRLAACLFLGFHDLPGV